MNLNKWNEDTDSEYEDEDQQNEVPLPSINQEFINNVMQVKFQR